MASISNAPIIMHGFHIPLYKFELSGILGICENFRRDCRLRPTSKYCNLASLEKKCIWSKYGTLVCWENFI